MHCDRADCDNMKTHQQFTAQGVCSVLHTAAVCEDLQREYCKNWRVRNRCEFSRYTTTTSPTTTTTTTTTTTNTTFSNSSTMTTTTNNNNNNNNNKNTIR